MVFVMLQGCMRLVADSVPVEHVLSGVCAVQDPRTYSVTMMYVSCCRFCSCRACSVWCL